MSEPYPYYAIYKLTGESAEATRRLVEIEREIVQSKRRNTTSSQRENNLLSRHVFEELQRRAPKELEKSGLLNSVIQIEKHKDGYPRAYRKFPHISIGSTEEEAVYIYCPIDYKGDHYVPDQAQRLDDKDIITTDFGEQIYKRKDSLSPPLLTKTKSGTALPRDFDPTKHRYREHGIEEHTYKVFIAGGGSLYCVKEFLQRKADLASAREKVKDTVEKLAQDIWQKISIGARAGDTIKPICFTKTGEDGKTEVWLRLTVPNRSSQSIIFRDNDWFTAADYESGAIMIKPNRETLVGQKLGRLFDTMLTEPDLGQYWRLWNPTASGLKGYFHSHSKEGDKVPQIDLVNDVPYLVYLIDDAAEKDHCHPPGGIPVNLAEYLWLKADLEDEDNLVRLPEPPPQLAHMRPVKISGPAP